MRSIIFFFANKKHLPAYMMPLYIAKKKLKWVNWSGAKVFFKWVTGVWKHLKELSFEINFCPNFVKRKILYFFLQNYPIRVNTTLSRIFWQRRGNRPKRKGYMQKCCNCGPKLRARRKETVTAYEELEGGVWGRAGEIGGRVKTVGAPQKNL